MIKECANFCSILRARKANEGLETVQAFKTIVSEKFGNQEDELLKNLQFSEIADIFWAAESSDIKAPLVYRLSQIIKDQDSDIRYP